MVWVIDKNRVIWVFNLQAVFSTHQHSTRDFPSLIVVMLHNPMETKILYYIHHILGQGLLDN